MGTTQALPLPLVLEVGTAVPLPTGEVGATELPLVVSVLNGETSPLPFAVALAWETAALPEMGATVLLAVELPADLWLAWKSVVLPVIGEEMEVWVPLPLVFLEVT